MLSWKITKQVFLDLSKIYAKQNSYIAIGNVACNVLETISDPCEGKSPQTSLSIESNNLICFESIDSYDLNYTNKKNITISGELFIPDVKKDYYNAVVMTHGSGGKRKYHEKYVELLTRNGIVVFQIDHYSARKIKYDKTFSKVSGITFMNDAYAALNILKSNLKINNVGYLGWSQGGVGPILSHFKFVNELVPIDHKFQSAVAISLLRICSAHQKLRHHC